MVSIKLLSIIGAKECSYCEKKTLNPCSTVKDMGKCKNIQKQQN